MTLTARAPLRVSRSAFRVVPVGCESAAGAEPAGRGRPEHVLVERGAQRVRRRVHEPRQLQVAFDLDTRRVIGAHGGRVLGKQRGRPEAEGLGESRRRVGDEPGQAAGRGWL